MASEKVPRDLCEPKPVPAFLAKLGNLMSVQPRRFAAETYQPENPQEYQDEQGRTQIKGCDIENYIRWRRNEAGQPESNSRLVRWEDGSYTLFIGNEAFEVDLTDQAYTFNSLRYQDKYFLQNRIGSKMLFKPCSIKNRMYIRQLEINLNPVKTIRVTHSLKADNFKLQEMEDEKIRSRQGRRAPGRSNRSLEDKFLEQSSSEDST